MSMPPKELCEDSIKANWDSSEALAELIREADRLYWTRESPISDQLFDRMVVQLREIAPDHKLLRHVGLRLAGWGNPVTHKHPMLSLEKCRTTDELLRWADGKESPFTITTKVDGVALSLRYDERGQLVCASTRGDGTTGEDVTVPVRRLDHIPTQIKKGPLEVRGELYFDLKVFHEYKDTYSSPRNAVAGYLKNQKIKEVLPLKFYPYDCFPRDGTSHGFILNQLYPLGFADPGITLVSYSDLAETIERSITLKTQSFETDGFVVRVANNSTYDELGTTAHHPRGAIAFKFTDSTADSVLKDVVWETSRSGAITPVAIFEPVKISGASLSRATLHNLGRFRAFRLVAGCTLEISRRGGVIPQIEAVTKRPKGRRVRTFEAPKECSSCGNPTVEVSLDEGLVLSCDSQKCPDRQINRLIHYAKVAGMKGFGPKVVKTLFEEDRLSKLGDFYNGSSKFWGEFVGEGIAANLIKEVKSHLSIPLTTFLAALGIPSLGSQTAKTIANHFKSLELVCTATLEEFEDLEGIGDVTADEISISLDNLHDDISSLLNFVVVLSERTKKLGWKGPRNPLATSFCFTGTLKGSSHADMETLVYDAGGTVHASVTANLNTLVENDPTENSSKSLKALELRAQGKKIRIISGETFLEMAGVDHVA